MHTFWFEGYATNSLACVWPTYSYYIQHWNIIAGLSYTKLTEIFGLIVYSQMKLCLITVANWICVAIRTLYVDNYI